MAIELPNLLSFERKLENSDALMFSGDWNQQDSDNWQSIKIIPRLNRSTQSAQGISDDKKIQPNPVASSNDDATLPLEHDTLKLSFTLRLIGNLGLPFACNSPEFETAIKQNVDEFKQTDMLDELAKRYAYNIANGRFLWRNRVGAKNITIKVTIGRQDSNQQSESLTFNAYDYSLNNFDNADENIVKLAKAIKEGLASDTFIFISVDAFVQLGSGQRVFPSQEMNMGEKRKVLFKIRDQAAMHNVKIGNALRTVDNWYPNAEFPIAAEPFGAVTQRGQAYRKSKIDLYTLMVAWVNESELTDEDKAYVVANLIRGGVFCKGGD